MPSKKKKYNARFPAGRIKKIMQTDEEVGKVAQAVPVIISRTLELFVESLLSKSLEVTQARCAKTLTPSHLKHCILAEARFDFLRDLVKNIPDISPAEDTNQGPSADSSPSAHRSHEPAPTAGEPSTSYRKPRQPAKKDNGQSSDSGSDYEPPKQKNQFRNGRNIPTRQYNGAYAADEQRYDRIRMDLPVTSTIPSREAKPVDLSLSTNSLPHNSLTPSSTITQQNPHLARLPNFYTETLKDTNDDEEVKPPVYSSVIQPNPEYGGRPSPVTSQNVPFGTYGKDKLSVAGRSSSFKDPSEYGKFDEPRLRIDLDSASAKLPRQNSAPSNYSSLSGTPLFHFDLSKLPITSNKLDEAPFTPTLLHQPLTPLLPGESSKYFQNPASESLMKYLSPPKKGPPPALQTLKRKSLLSEALKSNTLEKIEEVSVPKIHIDLSQAQAGHVPKFHLDLTNYNFEAPLPSSVASCGTTPKRKKSLASNEPPPLLPIESLQKNTDFKFGKSSPKKAADLIDDDYDA